VLEVLSIICPREREEVMCSEKERELTCFIILLVPVRITSYILGLVSLLLLPSLEHLLEEVELCEGRGDQEEDSGEEGEEDACHFANLDDACVIRDSLCGLGSQILGKALTKERKTSNFKEWEVMAEIKALSRGSSGQISHKILLTKLPQSQSLLVQLRGSFYFESDNFNPSTTTSHNAAPAITAAIAGGSHLNWTICSWRKPDCVFE
jgi:hypothetical protein